MALLVDYITREWNSDFWIAFFSKTCEWSPENKARLLARFHRMIQVFKVLLKLLPAPYMPNSDRICSAVHFRT